MTERKARQSQPRRLGRAVAYKPKNNYFATLMETPEGRELRRQWSTKKRKNPGRLRPDGYRREEIEPIRAAAKKGREGSENRRAIRHRGRLCEERATDSGRDRQSRRSRERLAAARLVLDFTKSKPASKQEVTISHAEEFLASLLDEDEDGSEATTGSQASSD